ncbi:MAG: hypothetical protein GDA56_33655 [Hormoscilla sp. GM7CHS1pb]|nr:hypothetical protein [Hormoscilla sp. GM7CHS1pb]MBC6481970.1 hypothetical protein [Hormoscilla sp. GM7CHS1pb]
MLLIRQHRGLIELLLRNPSKDLSENKTLASYRFQAKYYIITSVIKTKSSGLMDFLLEKRPKGEID